MSDDSDPRSDDRVLSIISSPEGSDPQASSDDCDPNRKEGDGGKVDEDTFTPDVMEFLNNHSPNYIGFMEQLARCFFLS